MSRILILHASVGTGHKTSARALARAFETRGAAQVWCEDALDYGPSIFRQFYVNSYIELSEKAPVLWSYFYERSDRDDTKLTKDLRTLMDRFGVAELDELVERCQPDAIVCTHFLPINMLGREKRKGRLPQPLYCIVTDYNGHVFWVNSYADRYFVATPKAASMLAQRGVHPSIISVTGIPIDPAIAEPKDRDATQRKHQLQRSPVVTLMGGGIDVDTMRQMTVGLIEEMGVGSLIVVAGRNKELETALQDLHGTTTVDLRILGFVDYLDDLVAASDLVVTKAGGLIVSEVMARHTPMVVVEPIPGQEEWNADHIVCAGAGLQVRLPEMVPLLVRNLLADPARLQALREGAEREGKPRAALTVAEKILQERL